MNELSTGWKIRHSLYFLWFLTVFFFFIAFLHIGLRTRNKRWMLYSLLYFLPLLVSFIFFILDVLPTLEYMLFLLFFVGLVLGLVHAIVIRKEYLHALAKRQRKLDGSSTKPVNTQETITKINEDPVRRESLIEAKKKMKTGWTAGFILASLNIVIVLFILFFNPNFLGVPWAESFIDIFILFLLSFGVYKGSRACAIILLAYYLFNQLFLRLTTDLTNVGSLIVVALFSYLFIQGIRGTFEYQRLKKESLQETNEHSSQGV
ncbi:hypothetical protein [Alteribacter aurantiacus]|uniref:hypothetical protein n=1 Tax=Alteribacter aurantiacus TaxID=254410 RepID=UPI000410D9B1|nr:hypothetical protein [Alteribacter aurantiacus]